MSSRWLRLLARASLGGLFLVPAGSIGWGAPDALQAQTADIGVVGGRLLGATRFQLAWLDWDPPRPVFLTALANQSVARDVAALPNTPIALLSVSSPAPDGRSWGVDGSDLLAVDMSSTDNRSLPKPALLRADGSESLSWPAWWPDGSAFVFQREDQAAPAISSPDGFARPPARIELANADGSGRRVLDPVAWQPSPAPDGSAVAFVRFTDRGSSLLVYLTADGSERVLVDSGKFPEIFSPRYSPDGTKIAFGARSYDDLKMTGLVGRVAQVTPRAAYAHGTLADVWLVNPDGAYTSALLDSASQDPAYGPDFRQRVERNLVSREDTVRQIVAKIQLGEGDAAVVYVTDVTAQVASQFVRIPLPEELQVIATYPIAVANGRNRVGGEAFVDFVQSPAAQEILARWGFIDLPPA